LPGATRRVRIGTRIGEVRMPRSLGVTFLAAIASWALLAFLVEQAIR
jgi:hypothetical protein